MKKRLVILGDGGHAKSVSDVALATGEYEMSAVLGLDSKNASHWNAKGIDWIHENNAQEALRHSTLAIVGLGQISDPAPRELAFLKLQNLGFELATIVSPLAYVSNSADVGQGSIVMHGAIVSIDSRVGENTIVNSMALLEHESSVGSHSHVSTGAILNGNCTVGDRTFIGSGTVVKQGIRIGSDCVIPMGSQVFADLTDGHR
jgi:sugar O-acyltransferase (sialic acid O-acetyltransferase NeuD family)